MAKAFGQLCQVGYTLTQAVSCTSTNAAQLLGFPLSTLAPGSPANFVLLDIHFTPIQVFLRGKSIY